MSDPGARRDEGFSVEPVALGRPARWPRRAGLGVVAVAGVALLAVTVAAVQGPSTAPSPPGQGVPPSAVPGPGGSPMVASGRPEASGTPAVACEVDPSISAGDPGLELVLDGGLPVPGTRIDADASAAPEWAWPAGPVVSVPEGAVASLVVPTGACPATWSVTGPSGLETSTDAGPSPVRPVLLVPAATERTEPLVATIEVDGRPFRYAWTLVRAPRTAPTVRLSEAVSGTTEAFTIGFCTLEHAWRNGALERRVCAGAYDPRAIRQVLRVGVGGVDLVSVDGPWTPTYVGAVCYALPDGAANGTTVSLSMGPIVTDACEGPTIDDPSIRVLRPGTWLVYLTVAAVSAGNQVYGDWMLIVTTGPGGTPLPSDAAPTLPAAS